MRASPPLTKSLDKEVYIRPHFTCKRCDTFTHSHTHTHTHTLTHSLTHTYSLSLSPTHTHTHTHLFTFTNACTHSHSRTDEGCVMVCTMLKTNTTITSLNMSQNNIRLKGAEAIAEMLKVNSTLKRWMYMCVFVNHIYSNVYSFPLLLL